MHTARARNIRCFAQKWIRNNPCDHHGPILTCPCLNAFPYVPEPGFSQASGVGDTTGVGDTAGVTDTPGEAGVSGVGDAGAGEETAGAGEGLTVGCEVTSGVGEIFGVISGMLHAAKAEKSAAAKSISDIVFFIS